MPTCTRPAEKYEFMPVDHFSRHSSEEIFGNAHSLEIDLGCGDGKFLTEMAQHYPERNFLGVERLLGRVRTVSRKIEELGLTNAKVLRLESLYTLEWFLCKDCVSRLHLLCPDPWPKAKHHKRRLVQQPFLTALYDVLVEGGEFLFKTDHPEYYEWVREELDQFDKFTYMQWREDKTDTSFFYPKTDFQLLWESQGKLIQRIRCTK